MDNFGNIHPIDFEPVRDLIIEAYKSGDFEAADEIIARNTVMETAMISRLVNGAMDAYCWSSGRGVSHMLSRTSHPGYTLQLTTFHRGHAWGDIDVKHAGKGELSLPDYEQFGRDSDGLEIDGVIHPERRGTECKLSSDER